jgi:N-acyl-L-homoserine lactone synthetase
VFAVDMPLFPKPTVLKELFAVLAAAPAPRVTKLELSRFALNTSAGEEATPVFSPKKFQPAINAA